jgi:hypothetical protein
LVDTGTDTETKKTFSVMTRKLLSHRILIAITGLALMTSLSVLAQPVPANLLPRAYVTLSMADHDYKGHRGEAMKQIAAAAKILRIDLHGDNVVRERQAVSDEQLRIARNLLEQARTQLRGRALKHVDKAINQINVALTVR